MEMCDSFGSDPETVIHENSTAIAIKGQSNEVVEAVNRAEYAGSTPHEPYYPNYQRSWMFSGEPLPHEVDGNKNPYELVRDALSPWKRWIWAMFYTYVLPDMEVAFIRHQQIENENNYKPVLLGTMCIKLKNEEKNFYYVRFIEKLGATTGFRKVEIVENKLVTAGSTTQHDYICKQITSQSWYVGYADPWQQGMITTNDLMKQLKGQKGFAVGNNMITSS
jgi:hypothetical protein